MYRGPFGSESADKSQHYQETGGPFPPFALLVGEKSYYPWSGIARRVPLIGRHCPAPLSLFFSALVILTVTKRICGADAVKKQAKNRKFLFQYPFDFTGDTGHIRPAVLFICQTGQENSCVTDGGFWTRTIHSAQPACSNRS